MKYFMNLFCLHVKYYNESIQNSKYLKPSLNVALIHSQWNYSIRINIFCFDISLKDGFNISGNRISYIFQVQKII